MNLNLESSVQILGILVIFGGFFSWLFRISLKPMRTVIENNTDAWKELKDMLTDQQAILLAHDKRIQDIETTHEILDCVHRRRKEDL